MCTAPVLTFPILTSDAQYSVITDASSIALAGTLLVKKNGKDCVVAYTRKRNILADAISRLPKENSDNNEQSDDVIRRIKSNQQQTEDSTLTCDPVWDRELIALEQKKDINIQTLMKNEQKKEKNQKATTIAQALVEHVFLIYSFPKKILSDLGRSFCSRIMKEICKFLGVKQIHSTAYTPTTQGSLERTHAVISDMLSHLINQDTQEDWCTFIPYITFCLNTTPNRSTNISPFRIMFGFDPVLPFDSDLRKRSGPRYNLFDYSCEFEQRLAKTYEIAMSQVKEIDYSESASDSEKCASSEESTDKSEERINTSVSKDEWEQWEEPAEQQRVKTPSIHEGSEQASSATTATHSSEGSPTQDIANLFKDGQEEQEVIEDIENVHEEEEELIEDRDIELEDFTGFEEEDINYKYLEQAIEQLRDFRQELNLCFQRFQNRGDDPEPGTSGLQADAGEAPCSPDLRTSESLDLSDIAIDDSFLEMNDPKNAEQQLNLSTSSEENDSISKHSYNLRPRKK
ncbi:hypothetical protein B566_EDAN003056 [Ephemera danica]|nr:hypothetical protein B566_EDAN003056 [Ephemera danica]